MSSNYENAPATKLLATCCCICGRDLVDAQSVERGIGPICNKKYGIADKLSKRNRAKANKLVYRASALVSHGHRDEALLLIPELLKIKANVVAAAVAKGLGCPPVAIVTDEDGSFTVKCPYSQDFLAYTTRLPGRRWDKVKKVTAFSADAKQGVWVAIQRAYPSAVLTTLKGTFLLGN